MNLESAKAADARLEVAKELAISVRGAFDTAAVLRGFLNSAKGMAACHQTEKEPASSSGGTRDSGHVLRHFLNRTANRPSTFVIE